MLVKVVMVSKGSIGIIGKGSSVERERGKTSDELGKGGESFSQYSTVELVW